MRQRGHRDVTVNGGKHGKHSPCGDPPNKRIKKPKRGEVNYLPDYPDGQDDSSLEDARQLMVNEMKKKNPNGALIKQKMDLTFALRRNEVVKDKPAVTQMCQRWPALFTLQLSLTPGRPIDLSHMLYSTEPLCCHQRVFVVLIYIYIFVVLIYFNCIKE